MDKHARVTTFDRPPAVTNLWSDPRWTIPELIAAKRGRTVSVVMPALNEEKTIGGVIRSVTPLVGSLVDELVVLDSGSTDNTRPLAESAGATVYSREEAVPDLAVRPGKGEVLWRSLAATSGDLIVFIDSDLVEPDPLFVPALLGPLLLHSEIQLVKGFYRRPVTVGSRTDDHGGGRVTQLVARPLLAALKPELDCVLQPLGGEYAATRALLSEIPFAPGYGVEIGILLDTFDRFGLNGIGQVNLGVREHRNRPIDELAVMSRQIVATLLSRLGICDSGVGLTTFGVDGRPLSTATAQLSLLDRPPMRSIDERSRSVRAVADA